MVQDFQPQLSRREDDFTISWTNLTYTFHNGSIARSMASLMGTPIPETRTIFTEISGHVTSGQIIGILGPSGAGKTILLESLIGKRFAGLSGRINVSNARGRKMKVAYIPQDDKMFSALTCREAVVFSSMCQNRNTESTNDYDANNRISYSERMRNYRIESTNKHVTIADRILEQMGLSIVADTRIGSCSGGQQKRISLAMALVVQPSVLVVDEPTSGLDSTAAERIIELLSAIAHGKTGSGSNCIVIVTIHQPNWKIFNIFDKIYMFTRTGGKVLYEGVPSAVPKHLTTFGARFSRFSNPADVIMEVACGCYPQEIIDKMVVHQEACHGKYIDEERTSTRDIFRDPPLTALTKKPNFPFFYLFYLVFMRAVTLNLRNPWMLLIRIGLSIATPLMIYVVYDDAGTGDGCPPTYVLGEDHDVLDPRMDFFDRFAAEDEFKTTRYKDSDSLTFNLSLMGLFLVIMPVLMTIPQDIPSVIKEVYNNWYSTPIYFLGRFFSEIPFAFLSQTLFLLPIYFITKMPDGEDIWRLFLFLGVNYAFAIGVISHGLLITAWFLDHVGAGVYVATLSSIPMLIACGKFIPFRATSMAAFYSTYLVYFRFVVETSLLSIFGWDRCGEGERESLTLTKESFFNWAFKVKSNMLTLWSLALGVNSTNLPTSINSEMSTVNDLTEIFSQTYLRKYFTRTGKATSMAIVNTDLDEDDLGPDLFYLFITSVIYLMIPFALIYRRVHRRE